MTGRILIVDDDEDTAGLLAQVLATRGFETAAVHSAAACLDRLSATPADVVLADVQMAGMSGTELCAQLRENHPDIVPILVTGQASVDVAIAAIRAGAYDYLIKPVTAEALDMAVMRGLTHLALRREVGRLRERVSSAYTAEIDGLAGDSAAIRSTIELVRRVAASDATVLITGESGTGKELIARALHQLSPRQHEPFVAVNCAAMPGPLLESELFGHMRGAFTDARETRAGLIAQARGGTIFLDEIGEMPIDMQVKILRVLQERTVRPVGSDVEVAFQARVIAATHRNLELEVAEKRFRQDLFYRVNVVGIPVPPLRERGSDILLLAQYFLRRIATRIGKPVQALSPGAARLLVQYDWPGNVRELENCMERAVALCRLDHITVDDLPDKLHDVGRPKLVFSGGSVDELVTLAEMQRRYIRKVLVTLGGNKTAAARVLGIDRRSIYRRLEESSTLA